MLLEKGAPVDAVGEVSAWKCGRVQEHGHAWESAGLLEMGRRALSGVMRKGATGGRCSYSHGAVLQDNNQPLHLASKGGHIETVGMLLEKGAPVDAVGEVSAWQCGRVQEHGACLGGCRTP